MRLESNVKELKGVGEKTALSFQKMNIFTVKDLIEYIPRKYDVYEEPVPISEVEEGKVNTISGIVFGRVQVGGSQKLQVTTAVLKDISGSIRVVWYRMPFLRNMLAKSGNIILRGKVSRKKKELVMEQPEVYLPPEKYRSKIDTLQPVYPLVTGVSNNLLIKSIRQVFDSVDIGEGILPENMIKQYDLMSYRQAMMGIHFPETKEEYYQARKRIVFEEFLLFILSLRVGLAGKERMLNNFCIQDTPEINSFLSRIPFELTTAQKTVWHEIKNDMTGVHVMSRLVQGDVGSGKTIVALLAMILAGMNGYQSAMMAPTEVLARQHFENITGMLNAYEVPLKPVLLTGSMTAKEKREVYQMLESGEADLIIGTHALIQEKVQYNNLALVITDEQHRFGVKQREVFSKKGIYPHILVMSATPIPRTLAIILYGDLDISVIGELPKNRLPIKNCVVDTGYRNTSYNFMKKQIAEGRQCYVICPMVEESENMEAENVTDYTEMLQEVMGSEIEVSCLHGKMKQDQKEEIMKRFAENEIQILVSTTVIEVGIDVPNSTVMLIENAERFGLAQLHQLRGRVGRGNNQSYCIFMSGSKSKETKERLDILNHSNDGFHIASEDLKLRGPGDLFGIRQSGVMGFKTGDIYQDAKILQQASDAAQNVLDEDPKLEKKEHYGLRKEYQRIIRLNELEKTL